MVYQFYPPLEFTLQKFDFSQVRPQLTFLKKSEYKRHNPKPTSLLIGGWLHGFPGILAASQAYYAQLSGLAKDARE